MEPKIDLEEIRDIPAEPYVAGANAPEHDGEIYQKLRFRLRDTGDRSLEALRHARRCLLREEWTLGRDSDEPSLEDAVFSPSEIVWVVRPEQKESCLRKLEELLARTNRTLETMELA